MLHNRAEWLEICFLGPEVSNAPRSLPLMPSLQPTAAPGFAFDSVAADALGVFGPNKKAPFHRWVTFTEGFSAQLVLAELAAAPAETRVFDPFGGTGTTPLVCAQMGLTATYAEVNPYLAEVAETKVLAATASLQDRAAALAEVREAVEQGTVNTPPDDSHPLLEANAERDFFQEQIARDLVGWVLRFADMESVLAQRLGRLAVASIAVSISNMKRAVDLRRRTPAELERARPNVKDALRRKVTEFADDLESTPVALGAAARVSADARSLPGDPDDSVDLVVTSPPYLNGTNYFRNTKLELLLLSLIDSETDLRQLRTQAITAGINNVSSRIAVPVTLSVVEPVAEALDEVAYDVRIPKMVRAYFSDMEQVLEELHRVVAPQGRLVLDIGDSRFAGVHVDTPELLGQIAEDVGWVRTRTEIIRSRTAKDGGALCQKLLHLCLS